MLDPQTHEVFSGGFSDVETVSLPLTGTYTLFIDGRIFDTVSGTYSFNVHPVTYATQPIVLGSTVSGTIGVPGERDLYSVSLGARSQLYFDTMSGDAGLTWSLSGPAGAVVTNQPVRRHQPRRSGS